MTQSLYVRKTYAGIRVRKKIDSDDPERLKEDEVILGIIAKKNLDIVRLIAAGTLNVRDAVDAYENGRIDDLPSADDVLPLNRAIDEWIDGKDFSPVTEREYRNQLNYVTRGRNGVTIGELPRYLARYRSKCKDEGHPSSFRIARAACQSLLKYKFDQYHRLWRECAKVSLLKETPREKPHLDMKTIDKVAEGLGEHAYMWYSMVFTGMLPSEYWGIWKVQDDRIDIYGTKRAGRRRPVPLIYVPQRPKLKVAGFTNAMKRAKAGVTPKNARDAFCQIALEAGIPRERVDMYLGHAPKSMLDLYSRHELAPHLEPDAALLRHITGLPALGDLRANLSIG